VATGGLALGGRRGLARGDLARGGLALGGLGGRSGPGGRGGLGGRSGLGGRGGLGGTAQDRPVVWIAQSYDAVAADVNQVDSLRAQEGAIGTAEVLQDPGVPVHPQDPVSP
jgi:hypothetical protein